jgi:two-component system, OmpR family, response regulator
MPKARAKILIVDDSTVVREAVAVMLEERGYDVVAIDSVFSFAQSLNREKPDLVLVDVNMPAMNGDKLVQIAQKHNDAPCPIVLFSDRDPRELERLAKQCGAAGFIPKTGNADLLAHSISVHLTKTRA